MSTEPLVNRQLTLFADKIADASFNLFELEMEARRVRSQEMIKLLRRLGAFLRARVIEPLVRAAERDRVYRELMALDDRTLADIGIARHQIPAIAAKVAARPFAEEVAPVEPALPFVAPAPKPAANDRKPALAA